MRALEAGADSQDRESFDVVLGGSGEHHDGLAGYWNGQGVFHSPSEPIEHTLSGGPITVAMLIDPRGSVQATAGLLPAVLATLPTGQVGDALEQIEVSFLVSPLLTPPTGVSLPVHEDTPYWDWDLVDPDPGE